MARLYDTMDQKRLMLCRQVAMYLTRRGFPASCLQYDPLYMLCGVPVLRFDLLADYIDPDLPEGSSYEDYFREKFGDHADKVACAFGIN